MKRRVAGGPSQRQLRVAEEVRHALVGVLQRGEVRDPGLAETPLTVTEVRMSPDLRQATAYVAPLGSGDRQAIVAALTRARSFLRRRVADQVRLRYAPNLTFCDDEVFDEAARIERLLRDPRVARDLKPQTPTDEDEGEDEDGGEDGHEDGDGRDGA
jgi:ribosome-binding factor A